jgi:hypothetical protein
MKLHSLLTLSKIGTLLFCLALSGPVFSQGANPPAAGGASGTPSEGDLIKDSLEDLTVIMTAGLGGAIIGLSTLSFAEEPKKHFKNVIVGGAVGVIVGVGIVVYRQASKSRDVYEKNDEAAIPSPQFDTPERLAWHQENFNLNSQLALPTVTYSFTF